jgi:excinuclease ABC subunit C
MLDKASEAMKLVQHLRNEAHRFGISHHRNQRSANFIQSELEQIKGIGPATIAQLFQTFKTLGAIKSATINQLETCVGAAKAKIIKDQQ